MLFNVFLLILLYNLKFKNYHVSSKIPFSFKKGRNFFLNKQNAFSEDSILLRKNFSILKILESKNFSFCSFLLNVLLNRHSYLTQRHFKSLKKKREK